MCRVSMSLRANDRLHTSHGYALAAPPDESPPPPPSRTTSLRRPGAGRRRRRRRRRFVPGRHVLGQPIVQAEHLPAHRTHVRHVRADGHLLDDGRHFQVVPDGHRSLGSARSHVTLDHRHGVTARAAGPAVVAHRHDRRRRRSAGGRGVAAVAEVTASSRRRWPPRPWRRTVRPPAVRGRRTARIRSSWTGRAASLGEVAAVAEARKTYRTPGPFSEPACPRDAAPKTASCPSGCRTGRRRGHPDGSGRRSGRVVVNAAAAATAIAVFGFGRFEPHRNIGIGMAPPLPEYVGQVLGV
ncbi:hypothetical protein AGLY_014703 [Aphis glycines]|uniref:Uncharacterized protein n=1 Tax=Aphis glycines TaxID=307491 RepID=A0A6G0T1Z2_APHGL|nr:hypothetical protein AGLY_014703 [Aphis glycines]